MTDLKWCGKPVGDMSIEELREAMGRIASGNPWLVLHDAETDGFLPGSDLRGQVWGMPRTGSGVLADHVALVGAGERRGSWEDFFEYRAARQAAG